MKKTHLLLLILLTATPAFAQSYWYVYFSANITPPAVIAAGVQWRLFDTGATEPWESPSYIYSFLDGSGAYAFECSVPPGWQVTTNGAEIFYVNGQYTQSFVYNVNFTPLGPTITNQPKSLTASPSSTITMNVQATGYTPMYYQWQFNSNNISGATNSTLTLQNVQTTNAGAYTVEVSNIGGSATSNPAYLSFLNANMYLGLTLAGTTGIVYEIDYCNNLAVSNWITLTNFALPTSPYILFDLTSPNSQQRFYKVSVAP